jgi:hypothetical protein
MLHEPVLPLYVIHTRTDYEENRTNYIVYQDSSEFVSPTIRAREGHQTDTS